MASGGAAAGETQVLVKFTTKLAVELRVSEAPLAVPASVKRLGLSRIINQLLNLDPARPFDFLVDGELVRTSLEKHLLDRGLSAEALLCVEYVPAVTPPEQKHSVPHDDWVSAVAALGGGQVLSGSYDGVARVWNGEAVCTTSFVAHSGGVSSVAAVRSSGAGGSLVLTAGKDQLVKLWRLPEGADAGGSCQLLATYAGHADGVECVAASPGGNQCVSSSWDGNISLWRSGDALLSSEEAAPGPGSAATAAGAAAANTKRRKLGADGVPEASGAREEAALSTLSGHLHCVSSVCWPEAHVLYSGGWDHSVRRWDAEAGVSTDTYNGSKAVLCVAAPPPAHGMPSLVAFCGADRCLRLWDVRGGGSGEALAVRALAPHAGWIASASWCPNSQHHVATASHDHSVKVWDIRTAVPLATLTQHTDKALCAAWLPAIAGSAEGPLGRIASGGADCTMRLYGAPAA